jgi:hypothetical protein
MSLLLPYVATKATPHPEIDRKNCSKDHCEQKETQIINPLIHLAWRPHSPAPGPKALTPFFFFSLASCLLLGTPTSSWSSCPARVNKLLLGPRPPSLKGKATPILPREPPFSSPHNVTPNPKDIIIPSRSVSSGKPPCPHREVPSTPLGRLPSQGTNLLPTERLFPLPKGDQPSW